MCNAHPTESSILEHAIDRSDETIKNCKMPHYRLVHNLARSLSRCLEQQLVAVPAMLVSLVSRALRFATTTEVLANDRAAFPRSWRDIVAQPEELNLRGVSQVRDVLGARILSSCIEAPRLPTFTAIGAVF